MITGMTYGVLNKFVTVFEEEQRSLRWEACAEKLLTLYFDILAYLKVAELYDERYVTYVTSDTRDLTLKLFCLDPSRLLRECIQKGKASIFFSATLTPLDYFTAVLGGNDVFLEFKKGAKQIQCRKNEEEERYTRHMVHLLFYLYAVFIAKQLES